MSEWAARMIPRRERELVLRELDELHERRAARYGALRADAWYLTQIVGFVARFAAEAVRDAALATVPLARDVGFSARSLLRRPGYFVAAVVTLGIGTGSVALVYGAANWVLLRDVPGVVDAHELTWLRVESSESGWGGITWGIPDADIERLRDRLPSLSGLEAAADFPLHLGLTRDAPAERVTGSLVTPGYFQLLRVSPALGRFFDPSEHRGLSGPPEAVLAHHTWERHWQGRESAIGAAILVNGRSYTVVGVAPEGFRGAELPGASDLWLASSAAEVVRRVEGQEALGGQLWNRLVGRRHDGVANARVGEEANRAIAAIREEFAGQWHGFAATHFVFRAYDGIGLDPLVRSDVQRTLLILMGGSAFLLLLAVANVANLALTRAASRRHLAAIRRALGAGSWRVGREPLVEGALIGLVGGALGLGLVLAGEWAFAEARLSARGASLDGMRVEGGVIAVSVVVSMIAGLLAGLAPALETGRERALEWLSSQRAATPRSARLRGGLVIVQVAFSGALLVGAGLFVRTVVNLNRIDLGVRQDAIVFTVAPGLSGYEAQRAREVLAGVEAQLVDAFGARAVGMAYPAAMTGWQITQWARLPGAEQDEGRVGGGFWTTGSGMLHALGIELLAGSGFRQDLLAASENDRPVMLNEAMADFLFPGAPPADVVGREIVLGREEAPYTVTAVTRNPRLGRPRVEPGPYVFRPYDVDFAEGEAVFYVAGGSAAPGVDTRVREAVRAVDPTLPVFDVSTVGRKVDILLAEQRIVARLASVLGGISLLLVAIGLFGVLSYTVNERTREIGVRVALGASTDVVRKHVIRRGVGLAAAGLLMALPLAWYLSRFVASRLYEVSPLDVWSYLAGAALLGGVAFVASWVPARRATSISPVDALRAE